MILQSVIDKLEFNKVLNFISKYCSTEFGKEKILNIKPFTNHVDAENEGKLVTEAKEILIKNEPPPIDYLPNLINDLYTSKIEGSLLNSKKILNILQLLITSRNLYQFLKNNSSNAENLFEIGKKLFVDKILEHHISNVVTENGEIKDNASKNLLEIRREIREKSDDLKKVVQRIIKDLSDKDIAREDYITLRDGRVVVPIKAEHKRHVRGFVHSESSSGQTVYIEPEETLTLNNEIVSLYFAERREIERILKELTKRIGISAEELINSFQLISHIDSVFAKAKYSIELIGCFPIFNDEFTDLKNAFHPILLNKYGRNNTVPLTIKIKNKNVILITGPNAGGKTVVLKTVGLLSLMAQSGIHIPASEDSNLKYFDKILLDIGDEQSIEDDLSTFSSHLLNIKNILNNADENSLILLDEIGTGTDPNAGSAIATATLIQLRDKGASILATTHHGNLKLIANDLPGFENASMEFDTQELKPTYKLKQGIPGSSYAFEIAKRIGFDDEFLNLANQYIYEDKEKVEKILVNLETQSQELEKQIRNLDIENARLKGLINLYQNKLEQIKKEKNIILNQTKKEAEKFLFESNKSIQKVIKEIKESNANKEAIKSANIILDNLKNETIKLINETENENLSIQKKDYKFKIDDFVILKDTNTRGKIIEISKDKNYATILSGEMKIQLPIDNLVLDKSNHQREIIKRDSVEYNYSSTDKINYRIDIRGKKPEEIEFEVVKFLDDAYTSNLDRVEILHGKGTGALKKTVAEILKKHEAVKNFYFAPVEFGGEGITIVELK